MESQRNNVGDVGFSAFSVFSPIQNKTNFESYTTTKNQYLNKKDNLFKTLIKQAQVFEEFSKLSKRISSELQTSYQEYLTQKKESELNKLGKENCNCKELIEAQRQLIDSLRARIKKLEVDSNSKSQDIKKLRQDINNCLELQAKGSIIDNKRNSFPFHCTNDNYVEKSSEKTVENLEGKNNRGDSWYYSKDEEFEIEFEPIRKREVRNNFSK